MIKVADPRKMEGEQATVGLRYSLSQLEAPSRGTNLCTVAFRRDFWPLAVLAHRARWLTGAKG